MVVLTVAPEISLSDEPVTIRVSSLKPSQLVTLMTSLTDEKGVKFLSRAFYRADENGDVDLQKAASLGGNYTGVEPMGLFWSLKPEKPFHRLMKREVMETPFYVKVEVFDKYVLMENPEVEAAAAVTLERWFRSPGVRRIPIREGRVRGALFLPPGDGPFPGVIDMFGGAGGLIEFRSSLLASRGFAALALAYFAYEDLPIFVKKIELEYFEEAAEILQKHPKVMKGGVGVIGVSLGATIALAMITFLKQISAVVCISGWNQHFGLLRYKEYKNSGLPYVPENIRITDAGVVDAFHTFGDLADQAYPDCILPVERARGQILFIVGEKDQNIACKACTEMTIQRMQKHGRSNYRMLSYPGAGHLIEPPWSPFCLVSWSRMYDAPVLWGGEGSSHARTQVEAWKESLDFLQHHVGKCGQSKL
ncbi:acyl-coenzyme A amino acid N-acyltransferase 2 isoform X2 [Latimeria chalumnae]|uniref:acyl-coenzyme A amino acid N-acyltransferase 2 isoform X2 n=1 Tax=Latimeria chalumnae TaxID=7897 RepID=UPI0003C19CE4|nr:PREDICTED: bile acid-CoA:amino acid N-acyltransferase isoform X2 [Latimeria chalumnae]|eukprot:XP_006013635.1 PREDICTED: bile acid-CoA:amino acid N-acyltransferase isoform X2 [Latimeria chalumnae]